MELSALNNGKFSRFNIMYVMSNKWYTYGIGDIHDIGEF